MHLGGGGGMYVFLSLNEKLQLESLWKIKSVAASS